MNIRPPSWTGWISNDIVPRRLTQSIAVEESPVPGILQTTVSIFSALLFLFIIWAAFATVEEVASAPGQIVPSGYIQNIQHLEGGIIRKILVQEGDLVEKDQPLIKLDAINAEADLGQMLSRQRSLQLQADRLRNFVDGEKNSSKLSPEERAILKSMQEARTTQQQVLNDQLDQKKKELQSIVSSRKALEKNVALMRKELEINRQMARKGSASKLTVMNSERELNALQGQYGAAVSQEKQAHSAITEAKSRLQSLEADLKQESMKDLGQTQAQLDEVNESISKLQSAVNRTSLNAPVRGIVKGLSVHTIGAVAEPGKVLMEIVPIESELIVEALISPTDIGNLKPGQSVKVTVSAFDSSRYGNVSGILQNISASTFQSEQGQTFYRAKIKLMHNYVGNDPTRNIILPGMTVQADIVTGEKTVLNYLLKPLHTVSQSAFRER